MILAVAIVKGYQQEIRNKVIGFNSHIQINNLDLNNSFETNPIKCDTALERELLKNNFVKHIQKISTKTGIMKTDDDFKGIVLKGVGKDYDWNFINANIVAGKVLEYNDTLSSNNIILSKYLADLLKLKINDAVLLYFVQDPPRVRKFKISGIFETGLSELDEIYAFVDIRHIQKLNNWSSEYISGYEVRIDDFGNLDSRIMKLTPLIPFNLSINGIYHLYPQLFDWLSLLDMNVVIIIVLMFIVAGINMITALIILILERSNMIGILKALGSTDNIVSRIFLNMAAYIIVVGLLIGNILGIGIALLQKHFQIVKLDQTSYYMSSIPIELNLTDLVWINLLSFAICMIILLIPARIVSRISPVKTIRFD